MNEAANDHDRRRHPRRTLPGRLSVELRVQGCGSSPAMLLTRGMVADISRSGLRCDIDFAVPVGTRVDVCFPEAPGPSLAKQLMDGRVVRTVSVGGVPDEVAIAFARPLEELDIDGLDASYPAPPRRGRSAAARRASWADEPSPFPTFATGSLR